MIVLPPVAAAQAGQATGGGLLDTFKNTIAGAAGGPTTAGAPPQTGAAPKGDGSIGLFDGVLKKTIFGGAAGAALGFIPFLPGGPVLGGILGALGGAAIGVFTNWRKIGAIKRENEAMLAAMGVQVQDPNIQQILKSGNVEQLIPYMEQAASAQQGVGAQQVPGVQQGVGQQTVGQALPSQQGPGQDIEQVTDPATGETQLIDTKNGVLVQQGAGANAAPPATAQQLPQVVDPTAAKQQSPAPTQGSVLVGGSGAGGAALNPNVAVSPGIAPSNANGGGGAAGDSGRPPAPTGVNGSNATAIAPIQAGIGMAGSGSSDTATAGVATLTADTGSLDRPQLTELVEQLKRQVAQLEVLLAEMERSEAQAEAARAS